MTFYSVGKTSIIQLIGFNQLLTSRKSFFELFQKNLFKKNRLKKAVTLHLDVIVLLPSSNSFRNSQFEQNFGLQRSSNASSTSIFFWQPTAKNCEDSQSKENPSQHANSFSLNNVKTSFQFYFFSTSLTDKAHNNFRNPLSVFTSDLSLLSSAFWQSLPPPPPPPPD